MNAKRLNYILVALFFTLVAGGVVVTVYANVWLRERSKTLVSSKLDTIALEEKQLVNQRSQTALNENRSSIEILEKVVPKNKDQAKTIAELLTIAQETGVSIGSISFPNSELGAAKTPTPTATEGAVAPTTTVTTPSVTQAKPVEGITGLLGVEVTLAQINRAGAPSSSGVSYSQLLDFLRAIERNRRTMQVKTLQISPLVAAGGSNVQGYSLTLSLNIFIKP